jgi:hypothetical protein
MQEWIISPSPSTGQVVGQGNVGASSRAYDWQPNASPLDPHEVAFDNIADDLAPVDAPLPENIVGGGEFDVAADFDTGGDGFDAGDFGPIPPNIQV